jgi:putative transcriptional regulator
MGGINNRLSEFRKQSNLSQEEFAEKVGVRRETILRVENGKYYPSLQVARDIAVALDKSIEEIFFP